MSGVDHNLVPDVWHDSGGYLAFSSGSGRAKCMSYSDINWKVCFVISFCVDSGSSDPNKVVALRLIFCPQGIWIPCMLASGASNWD